jgi:hypothetical protein
VQGGGVDRVPAHLSVCLYLVVHRRRRRQSPQRWRRAAAVDVLCSGRWQGAHANAFKNSGCGLFKIHSDASRLFVDGQRRSKQRSFKVLHHDSVREARKSQRGYLPLQRLLLLGAGGEINRQPPCRSLANHAAEPPRGGIDRRQNGSSSFRGRIGSPTFVKVFRPYYYGFSGRTICDTCRVP